MDPSETPQETPKRELRWPPTNSLPATEKQLQTRPCLVLSQWHTLNRSESLYLLNSYELLLFHRHYLIESSQQPYKVGTVITPILDLAWES